MSRITKKSSERAQYQMIIDAFKDDGVICNFRNKTYDEHATYNGGTGYRNLFKQLNDEIILYHKLLRALTGERRANVYETIPVIDFLNYDNTSLLSTYKTIDDEIDNSSIEPIDCDPNRTALDWIEAEDQATLNRAVMGKDTGEHFYNTVSQTTQCPQIQTSHYNGDHEFIYNGEWVRNISLALATSGEAENNSDFLQKKMSKFAIKCDFIVYKITGDTAFLFKFDDSSEFNGNNGPTGYVSYPNNDKIKIVGDKNKHLFPFVNGKDADGYKLKIDAKKNDLVVIVPRVTYVGTTNRILLLKASNNTEDFPTTQTYTAYLLYIDTYSPDTLFQATTYNIAVGDSLQDFLVSDYIREVLGEFLSIEKNFYSDSSGLLNGLFCEPYEWNDLGDNRTVTKWKLCNDVNNHKEITIGSHFAGKGLANINGIKASPLKLTSNDSASSDVKGKAYLFYKKMMENSSDNLMTAMLKSSRISDWYDINNPSCNITSLVTRYDYDYNNVSKSNGESAYGKELVNTDDPIQYENKFRNEKVIIDKIDHYLDSYDSVFVDRDPNGFATKLELISDKASCVVEYGHMHYKTGGIFNWDIVQSSKGSSYDLDNKSLLNTFMPSFHTRYDYVYHHNEDRGLDHKRWFKLDIVSPYNLFKKKNTGDNETILVYPEVLNIYPNAMYLITRKPLFNITNKEDFNAKTRTLFLSYQNKFMMFNISRFYNFSMNYISSIYMRNVNTSNDMTVNIDELISEIYRAYANNPNISMKEQLKDIQLQELADKLSDFNNCYVYKLTAFQFNNGSSDIKIYDEDDKLIDLGEGLKVIGASYPSSYFKLNGISEDVNYEGYNIISTDISKDFEALKKSSITLGIPNISSPSDLDSYKQSVTGPKRQFLDSFSIFIKDDNNVTNVFTSSVYRQHLGDFNISSVKGELTLRDIPMFVSNLKSLMNLFKNVVNNITVVDENGNTVVIKSTDFDKLRYRMTNNSSYSYQELSLSLPKFTCNSNTSFVDNMTNWATSSYIRFDVDNRQSTRKSLEEVAGIVNEVLNSSRDVKSEDFKNNVKALDEVFGNNTEPLITIGDSSTISSYLRSFTSQILERYLLIAEEAFLSYYGANDSDLTLISVRNMIANYANQYTVVYYDSDTRTFKINIPNVTVNTHQAEVDGVTTTSYEYILSNNGSTTKSIGPVDITSLEPMIDSDHLSSLADYIKSVLEGVNNSGQRTSLIRYTKDSDRLEGESNGLYYKRYEVLNSRMNTINGPLHHAGMYLKSAGLIKDINKINESSVNTYKDIFSAIPIADIEPMSYIATQKASDTQIPLEGKFYSDKEMEALRNQINSSCVLTCTNCKIKDSCPFYDQEEVLKLYCTGLSTIDFYVKDNELELLDKNSFSVSPNSNGSGFDMSLFDKIHDPYADITNDERQTFSNNALNDVRDELQDPSNSIDLKYSEYVHDDLGWLVGGRYGTVTKNTLKDAENEVFQTTREQLHDYKYLYDALFIDIEHKDTNKDNTIPVIDNDSYIDYKISDHTYDIDFEVGEPGNKVKYSGKTRIKVPRGLKLFKYANKDDSVYLVSDDEKDPEGLPIVPCIYLGKVGEIQLAFDYSDDGYPLGVTDPKDTRLYAKDIAQWCANYYKGCLAKDPIGYTKDEFKDRDQYWMEYVYKKIDGRWCEFPGRKRVESGYADPLIDTNEFDSASAISGHPVVNTYVDFVRKVSIRMYDSENDKWLIPFVDESLQLPWPDLNYDQNVEIQKRVLSLMKTNLRLVVFKNNKKTELTN